MNRARAGARAVLWLRVLYGLGLVAAPERLGGGWLGPASRKGATQVPLRALGAREIGLHVGALRALRSESTLVPWLASSIAGDLTDVVATLAARRDLPPRAAWATLAVGGGSALLTALILRSPVAG